MKNKKHLPFLGPGPFYAIIIVFLTLIGMYLSINGFLNSGKLSFLKIPFIVLAALIIILAAVLYLKAVFQAKVFANIKSNTLVTDGVYAYVRNPIYTAISMLCIGVLIFEGNLWLLILPFVFWLFMTILMKNTEEKWLIKLYGRQYIEYCEQVNRCIPWFKKKIKV